MAENDFDFGALKALKLAQYEKEYCKSAIVRKAGAAIIFVDYKLSGKKTPCVVLTFKKYAEAAKVFKDIKTSKEHFMKKTALAEIIIGKGADGKEEITVDLKKGGISPAVLQLKGEDLFVNTIGMALKIIGGAEAELEPNDVPESESEETTNATANNNSSKENISKEQNSNQDASKLAQKEDRASKIALMKENVDKMEKAVGTTSKEKLEPNVLKYEAALAQLTKAAQVDGVIDQKEQASIDELKAALENLKKSMNENNAAPQSKKLTEEQKVKIKENMTKINARLEAIVKELGL
jgi:hypothetical protein